MRGRILKCLIVFLLGVMLSQLIGQKFFEEYTVISRSNLKSYAYLKLPVTVLFWNLFWKRVKMLSWIILASMTRYRKILFTVIGIFFLFSLGFFTGGIVLATGIGGVLIPFAAIFPHGIFYGLSIWMICSFRMETVRNRKKKLILLIGGVVALTLTGCILEATAGGGLLQTLLRLIL